MIIYLARNKVNGKCYVGITRRSLAARQVEHRNDAASHINGMVFHAAIRKHGFGAFEWTVLGEATSCEELRQKEIQFIADLRPEYNMSGGGDGQLGVKFAPERIDKMKAGTTASWDKNDRRERQRAIMKARWADPAYKELKRQQAVAQRARELLK